MRVRLPPGLLDFLFICHHGMLNMNMKDDKLYRLCLNLPQNQMETLRSLKEQTSCSVGELTRRFLSQSLTQETANIVFPDLSGRIQVS